MRFLSELFPALADLAARGTLIVLAAAVLVAAMRRASAASRHLVWSGALAAAVALPVMRIALPAVRVGMLPASAASMVATGTRTASPVPSRTVAAGPAGSVAGAAPGHVVIGAGSSDAAPMAAAARPGAPGRAGASAEATPPRAGSRQAPAARVAALAVLLWIGGALAMLLRGIAGSVGLARLARRADAERDATLLADVRRIAAGLGIRRTVRLLRAHEACIPVTWGLRRPTILLPAGADAWDAERRALVLTHELGHVARFDVPVHVIAQAALALHWFNPFVWLAVRRARAERERACDDLVLTHGARPSRYASDLLEFVRALRPPREAGIAALAMARRSEFEGRLLAILDPALRRGGVSRWGTSVALGAFALAIPVATLQPARRQTATATAAKADTTPARQARASTAARKAAGARPASATAVASTWSTSGSARGGQNDCSFTGGGSRITSRSNPDQNYFNMVRSDDSSCVILEARGTVGFTDADDDVATVSPRGFIHVMQRLHGVTQEYRVDADASGTLTRVYRRDSEDRPPAEAHEWLTGLVPVIERESGIGAEARVARLRQHGGVRAVLDDARLIDSDGVKRRYLDLLIQSGSLTTDDLEGITKVAATISSDGDRRGALEHVLDVGRAALVPDVVTAAHDISSDGDKASVLLHAIGVLSAGDSIPAAFFSDAESISSDGDKARVLSAVARARAASPANIAATLKAARGIASDGDKARVLLDVIRVEAASPALLAQTVAVASGISSDGDKARVLLAVVRADGTTKAVLRATVAAAHRINADGDKANVLRTIARLPGATDKDVRADIVRAAKSISSDGDYRSVMNALGEAKGGAGN